MISDAFRSKTCRQGLGLPFSSYVIMLPLRSLAETFETSALAIAAPRELVPLRRFAPM